MNTVINKVLLLAIRCRGGLSPYRQPGGCKTKLARLCAPEIQQAGKVGTWFHEGGSELNISDNDLQPEYKATAFPQNWATTRGQHGLNLT